MKLLGSSIYITSTFFSMGVCLVHWTHSFFVSSYEDEKHFTFTTIIETSPQFYGWLCGLGKGVRIVSPPEVVEEMGNYVKGIAEMY